MSASRINIVGLAPIGTVISRGGQHYVADRHQSKEREDGSTARAVFWSSRCATCATPIEVMALADRWPEIRRCREHSGFGRRVTKRELEASGIIDAPVVTPAKARAPKSPQRSYLDRAKRLALLDSDASDLI